LRGAAFFLEPAISRVPPECRVASPVRAKFRQLRYVRYMDDIVLLARTRWEFRRAIAALHEEIAALGLHLHRVKRFVGRGKPNTTVRHRKTQAGRSAATSSCTTRSVACYVSTRVACPLVVVARDSFAPRHDKCATNTLVFLASNFAKRVR
jgi:hypothetical protein